MVVSFIPDHEKQFHTHLTPFPGLVSKISENFFPIGTADSSFKQKVVKKLLDLETSTKIRNS